MWKKERQRLLLALRAGMVLGLVGAALWVLSFTANPEGVQDKLEEWGSMPTVTVGLLANQLGVPPKNIEEAGLSGWGARLIEQSAFLKVWEAQFPPFSHGGLEPEPELELPADTDSEEPPLTTPQEEHTNVLEMTSRGETVAGAISNQGVYLVNKTDRTVTSEDLEGRPFSLHEDDGPQILIVHTHGSEAYTQTSADPYEESDPYRTTDCTKNVVRVGEEMAMELRSHGFRVLHDTNLYDYPSYNGAYERSGAAVEQWLEQYPSIQIVLDVHRDALVSEEDQPYKMVSMEAGKKVAQVMLVVGSDAGGSAHPTWRDNLAFAAWLQRGVVNRCSNLARPMVLRSSRYNQQILTGSLLVEVGGHGNTLTEAIEGARLWADSAARMLLKK